MAKIQLGARAIHALAGEAETAMRGSDPRRAAELGHEIDAHMRRLHEAAAVIARPSPSTTPRGGRPSTGIG
jgi:hypothetical protein